MRNIMKRGAVIAALAAGAVALASTGAYADLVYNTLDVSIDATHEAMNLTAPGADGTTTLKMLIEGRSAGDHPGCNIQGGAHYIGLDAITSDSSVATVAFVGSDTFNTCNDTLTVDVTPVATGTATITFAIDDAKTSNDPNLTFGLDAATFDVHVNAGTITPVETVCDADPAAPAWAAAILQKNGVKAKAASNYISMVAQRMTQGAQFDGNDKSSHPAYETAVYTYLSGIVSGLTQNAQAAARPGWECTPV